MLNEEKPSLSFCRLIRHLLWHRTKYGRCVMDFNRCTTEGVPYNRCQCGTMV